MLFIFIHSKNYFSEKRRKIINYIIDHDKACRLTFQANSYIKYHLLIYYYLIVPALDLAIICILSESNIYIRNCIIFIVLIFIFNSYLMTFILSFIAREAHSSYSILNSMIARNRLPIRVRLKVLALIERLSGPVIGLYCYDLFPFTNYEFFLFVVNCVSNFRKLFN